LLTESQDRPITVRGQTISPALFLAPMAGVTHSAFRRLLADFGGYGALFTEMLSGPALLSENNKTSPYTKYRPSEGKLIYQLLLKSDENIPAIVEKLRALAPFAVDLNLGCPAPKIRKQAGGSALFADYERLERILAALRESWDGILTVKCRLGADLPGWRERFVRRLKCFENTGVDLVFVHPRFAGEKLRRRSRWSLFQWISEQTALPIIANGDITGPDSENLRAGTEGFISGVMIGRAAVVRPWLFRLLSEPSNLKPDYLEIWERYYSYVLEDFPPEKAIGRLKEFAAYYARNFFFGHELYRRVQGASSIPEIRAGAAEFLAGYPRTVEVPSIDGI